MFNSIELSLMTEINEKGYVVLDNFVEGTELYSIKEEVDNLLDDAIDDESYKFGKSLRIGSLLENMGKNNAIYRVFCQPLFTNLAKQMIGNEPEFNELFVTHEYRNNLGLEANGHLHFDKIWTFKSMLYLTDVTKDSGALSVIPGTHKEGKILRHQAWTSAAYDYANVEEVKNKIFEHFSELDYDEKDVVPLEGAAGTVIFFHTDLFHRGGILLDGEQRKLIRAHWRHKQMVIQ